MEIRIQGLRRMFPAHGKVIRALDGVDLDIPARSIFTLLGPSGCGKTTLLRCIVGLEVPDAGEIAIGGETVFSSARGIFVPPEKRGLGMVFQTYAIWPHMNVFQNVAYPLETRKLPRMEIRERVRRVLEFVQLAGLESRPATRLSGGQQQRVALARALVAEPRVILFDEPLSNLDAKLRTQTRIEIKRLLRRFAITALYVTHDQTEALALADRIAIMRQGQVDQIGTYAEIYERPANTHVAGFMGSPPMNLVPMRVTEGRLCAEGLQLPLPAAWAGVLRTGQQVVLGVRPEHLRVEPAGPLHTVVDVVEPVLSQRVQYVYFMLAGRRLVARLPEDLRLAVGDPLSLAMPESALHLFDHESRQRLPDATGR